MVLLLGGFARGKLVVGSQQSIVQDSAVGCYPHTIWCFVFVRGATPAGLDGLWGSIGGVGWRLKRSR